MKKLLAALAALVTGAALTAEPSESYKVRTDDPELTAAAVRARQTAAGFLDRALHPGPGEELFCVSVLLKVGDGSLFESETLWLTALSFDAGRWSGVLLDEPDRIRTVHEGDRLSFDPGQIADWRYVRRGELVGGESLRILLSRLSPAQRNPILTRLSYRVPGFPVAQGPVDRHLWSSPQGTFQIRFPEGWGTPASDDESVLTKGAVQVYCPSPSGASAAVFQNPAAQFAGLDDAASQLRRMVVRQFGPEGSAQDLRLKGLDPTRSRAFYYRQRDDVRVLVLLAGPDVVVTLSVLVPNFLWPSFQPDLENLAASVRFTVGGKAP